MKKRKRLLFILQVMLLGIVVLSLSSCDVGLEIVSVDVIQLPYRTVYVAGMDDALDMKGCIISIRTRDGYVQEISFADESRIRIEHEIDFSTPGEYKVFFYWGRVETSSPFPDSIYTMTIQVIAPD